MKKHWKNLMGGLMFFGIAVLVIGCTSLTTSPPPIVSKALKNGRLVTDRSKVCIVQDTFQNHRGILQRYHGKDYYLCCRGCVEQFQKHPEQLTKSKDPISGAVVDKAVAFVYARGEKVYYFENQANLEQFDRHPSKNPKP